MRTVNLWIITLFAAATLTETVLAEDGTTLSGIELNPGAGSEIGLVFQGWMSPHQQGGEEEDTPSIIPPTFRSTEPSIARNDRPSRGHATLSFTRDLSKAHAHVKIEGVDAGQINMFHIHCGRPGMLGPILIDFGMGRDLSEEFADGEFTAEITNKDIEDVVEHADGLLGLALSGCPIIPANPLDKVKTVAGMATIALEGELYYNLHTTSQTYFGDIRGQLLLVD